MASILEFTEYDYGFNNQRQSKEFEGLHAWLTQAGYTADPEDRSKVEFASRLGCYCDGQNIRSGGWAGLVRIGDQEVAVLPRKAGKGRVDLVRMYLECMSNPLVAAHLGEPAVFIWHDQKPIECPVGFIDDALILLVLSYLRELHEVCLRHLRNQYIGKSENLTGRVKGRIDLAKQIRLNLPRGRLDRMACHFTIHSNNSRENQILKTALERSARLLSRYRADMQLIWPKIHFCRKELGDVDEVVVTPQLFEGIRYSGLFLPYKNAHHLAKLILNTLPPDPHSGLYDKPTKVPPFAICTYELFERYCEVQLRKIYSEQSEPRLWIGYQDVRLGNDKVKRLRPDFLLCSSGTPKHRWIIDAKNKTEWPDKVKNRSESEWDSDVPQLCRYSRYVPILEEMGFQKGEQSTDAPKMVVLYPKEGGNGPRKLDVDYFENSFEKESIAEIQNLQAFGIDVPTH